MQGHGRKNQTETRINTALEMLKSGYSCSESVLMAYGPGLGLSRELSCNIASGFGGGMGLMGETCGAITAAYMVIGLAQGASHADKADGYVRALTYESVTRFAERFKQRNGSTLCRDITDGVDMSTTEGRTIIRAQGKVTEIVSETINILEAILQQDEHHLR